MKLNTPNQTLMSCTSESNRKNNAAEFPFLRFERKQTPSYLVCPISSQTRLYRPEFDEIIKQTDWDFSKSNLKNESIIRIDRLFTTDQNNFSGELGEISKKRTRSIRKNLANWIISDSIE